MEDLWIQNLTENSRPSTLLNTFSSFRHLPQFIATITEIAVRPLCANWLLEYDVIFIWSIKISIKKYLSADLDLHFEKLHKGIPHYRPQTKFAKVMFSREFVHRGTAPWTEIPLYRDPPPPRHRARADTGTPSCTETPLGQKPTWTETPRTVTSGQYASYWNAFLFMY